MSLGQEVRTSSISEIRWRTSEPQDFLIELRAPMNYIDFWQQKTVVSTHKNPFLFFIFFAFVISEATTVNPRYANTKTVISFLIILKKLLCNWYINIIKLIFSRHLILNM